jgi:reactive intermediate/imine deaminase
MVRTTLLIAALCLICAASSFAADGVAIERQPSPVLDGRNLPFSAAVKVGTTLYLSGQVGSLPGEMALAHGGIKGETKQAIENIKAVLEQHGANLESVAKCTVFMADINEWGQMNEVYKQYFAGAYPARSAIGVNGLALGARVELECIAIVTE